MWHKKIDFFISTEGTVVGKVLFLPMNSSQVKVKKLKVNIVAALLQILNHLTIWLYYINYIEYLWFVR